MLKKSRNSKGFTLIELLLVVAIVGILATLLIPNAVSAIQRAKQKGTMKEMAALAVGLVDYVIDNGTAPDSTGDMDSTLQGLLSPFYLPVCPTKDKWGNTLAVHSGQDSGYTIRGCTFYGTEDFLLISFGRDSASDGVDYDATAPEAGHYTITDMSSFNNDWRR